MSRRVIVMLMRSLLLLVLPSFAGLARAQDATSSTVSIAPIGEYLMDRTAEIALARSGAPDSISSDAEVMVLTAKGYETAVKGKNGFVCMVERGWMNDFDDVDFGNPKLATAICLNPPAARTHLPITFKRTELALARASKAEMRESLKAAFDKEELPTPEAGSMCYMMSKDSYFGKAQGHLFPHVMFFLPLTAEKAWGANLPGSPIMAFQDNPDRFTVFLLLAGKWSDGTPAPTSDSHQH